MGRNTPRAFALTREAIAIAATLESVAQLRAMAREQWADDDRLWELEALLDKRADQLLGKSGTQIPLDLPDPDREDSLN